MFATRFSRTQLIRARMRHFYICTFPTIFDPLDFRQNFYSPSENEKSGGWTRLTVSVLATCFLWELPSVHAAKAAWWNLERWRHGSEMGLHGLTSMAGAIAKSSLLAPLSILGRRPRDQIHRFLGPTAFSS